MPIEKIDWHQHMKSNRTMNNLSILAGEKISRKFQIPHSYEWVQKLFIGETYVIRFGENPNYIWRKSKFEWLQLNTHGRVGGKKQ